MSFNLLTKTTVTGGQLLNYWTFSILFDIIQQAISTALLFRECLLLILPLHHILLSLMIFHELYGKVCSKFNSTLLFFLLWGLWSFTLHFPFILIWQLFLHTLRIWYRSDRAIFAYWSCWGMWYRMQSKWSKLYTFNVMLLPKVSGLLSWRVS